MAEQKTKQTEENVTKFLTSIEDETKRKDSFVIMEIMQQATGFAAKMWGANIVGFGSYHYKYESGREGESCLLGFSPRKQAITLYLMMGNDNYEEFLKKLGKHKTGKGCLYINKLTDVDINVLKQIIEIAFDNAK